MSGARRPSDASISQGFRRGNEDEYTGSGAEQQLDEHGMPVEVDEEGNPIVNERATWDASNPRRSRSSFVGRLLKVGRYHYRGADVPPRRF